MPPKPKFKREEIIAAAVDVTRESGIGAVSAREIAAHLGTSTRPIFTYFATMEELKQEIANTAEAILRRYVTDGLNTAIPFFGLGVNYIQFALDEPELYRLLYLTRVGPSNAMAAMEHVRARRDSIMRIYNMNERARRGLLLWRSVAGGTWHCDADSDRRMRVYRHGAARDADPIQCEHMQGAERDSGLCQRRVRQGRGVPGAGR